MQSIGVEELSTAESLRAAIERTLPGIVTTITDEGDAYLFYDPDGLTDPTKRIPVITLITSDHSYDNASKLDRNAATYRVNFPVSRERYESWFGQAPRQPAGYSTIDTGHDYARTDCFLPHPLYSPLHWVCVVNPGSQTFDELRELLTEAHESARRRYAQRQSGHSAS